MGSDKFRLPFYFQFMSIVYNNLNFLKISEQPGFDRRIFLHFWLRKICNSTQQICKKDT